MFYQHAMMEMTAGKPQWVGVQFSIDALVANNPWISLLENNPCFGVSD